MLILFVNWHVEGIEAWERGNQEQSLLLRSEWISLTPFSVVPFVTMETVLNAACKYKLPFICFMWNFTLIWSKNWDNFESIFSMVRKGKHWCSCKIIEICRLLSGMKSFHKDKRKNMYYVKNGFFYHKKLWFDC